MPDPKKTIPVSITGLPPGFDDELRGLLGGQRVSTKRNPWDAWPSQGEWAKTTQEEDWFGSQRWPAAPPFDPDMTNYESYQKQLAAIQGARAFAVSQFGREEQRFKNQKVDDKYTLKRQAAEGAYLAQQDRERQQQAVEMQKKREALKGPREWMQYMTEVGEQPSWIGYWMAKKGVENA